MKLKKRAYVRSRGDKIKNDNASNKNGSPKSGFQSEEICSTSDTLLEVFQQFQVIPSDRSVPPYPGFTSFSFRSFFVVYPVGNRRYTSPVHAATYECNVIADIGRWRSRIHGFIFVVPTSFSASAGGLFTAE